MERNPATVDLDSEQGAASEQALRDFEEAWRRGDRPALEDYLPATGAMRRPMLVELTHLELEYRLKAGEPVRIEEYLRRFAELGADQATVQDLVLAEYRLRRRREPDLSLTAYRERFPQIASELAASCETPLERAASGGEATCPTCGSRRQGEGIPPAPAGLGERSRLGRYDLLEVIGLGASAIVYRARDVELGRLVAVKVWRPGVLGCPEDAKRFLREARCAAGLRHPNIVTLLETGESAGQHYLVYELVQGMTLADRLRTNRPDFTLAATWLAQVSDALEQAHQQGVVHRDLKPSNILLDGDGRPLIADFGLAWQQSATDTLTREGDLVGTPAYMSPEQARGAAHAVDARSDVYSLGVLLYEMLTGAVPFRGTTSALVRQILDDDPVPPRRLNHRVPRDLETICLHCLEKEPSRRYRSAAAVAADLRHFLAGEPIAARPVGVVGRGLKWMRRRPTIAAMAAVSVAALALLVGGALWQAGRERQHVRTAEAQAEVARSDRYAAEMNLAYAAWNQAAPERARELLERQVPSAGQTDLREFGWYHLGQRCQEDLVLRGHAAQVAAVAFSPDGRLLASASWDKTIKLWDTATWTEQATLRGHGKEVSCLAFSPNGQVLATGSWDGRIKLWDPATGREKQALAGHPGQVNALAFSPDGNTLASGGANRDLRLIDVPSGRERAVLLAPAYGDSPPARNIYSVAFSPDGRLLAAAYWEDRTVKIWDLDRREVGHILPHNPHGVLSVAFSSDGTYLATCNLPGTLTLWEVATSRREATANGFADARAVAALPGPAVFAVGTAQGKVHLWDGRTQQIKATLTGHTGRVTALARSPDGQTLATGAEDRTVRLWDLTRDPPIARPSSAGAALPGRKARELLGKHQSALGSVVYGPDGSTVIATATYIQVFHPGTGELLAQLGNAPGRHSSCALLVPGTTWLVSGGKDKRVRIWDLQTYREVTSFQGHSSQIDCLAVSPDGRTVAMGSFAGEGPFVVKLWDLHTCQERAELQGHTDWVAALAFSPDGTTVATAGADETVRLWDVDTGREITALRGHHGIVRAVAFAPDGLTLASGGWDNSVRLWDLATFQERSTLRGHTSGVTALAFSTDGQTLASGSQDMTIKLWLPASGRELGSLQGHAHRVSCLAFSPDGTTLASGGFDWKVYLWHAPR